MDLNDEQINLLTKFIIDMIDNGYVDNTGNFTKKAHKVHREICGPDTFRSDSGFTRFIDTCGWPLKKEKLPSIIKNGYIWLMLNDSENWGWLREIIHNGKIGKLNEYIEKKSGNI